MKKTITAIKPFSIFNFMLITFNVLPAITYADTLSPESIYYRCYAHMTRTRPPANDARLPLIKSGRLSYIDACMQVFDLASLNKATGRLAVETPESIKVLENFNRFHMSWFDDVNVFNALIPGGENMNHFLHDGGEAALHFTHAIFHPEGRLEDAITSNDTWQAIRSEGYTTFGIYPTTFKRADNWGTKNTVVRVGTGSGDVSITSVLDSANAHNGLHLQMGKLVGIMPMEHVEVGGAISSDWATATYSASNKANITKSFGGGLLGTQGYLMINRPRQTGQYEDGGLRSSRIYSKQVFKEILCRDIPVIQQKDAIPHVDSSGNNPFPFRNGSSCMQCHASIDSLGWTTRDLRLNRTGNGGADNFLNTLYFIEQYKKAPIAQEPGAVFKLGAATASDTNFHKRPPKGQLYFRTFDGKLISEQVEGLTDLGTEISKLDDYYVCASKRYFEFFTGHKIILEDITNPNSQVLNDKQLKLRNYVIDLGKKLHSHQKMRNIVKDIISSDFYKTADYEIKYK